VRTQVQTKSTHNPFLPPFFKAKKVAAKTQPIRSPKKKPTCSVPSVPSLNVYDLAANLIQNDTETNACTAIRSAFKLHYPYMAQNSEVKTYMDEHVRQFCKLFKDHPWFQGPVTAKNQILRAQALHMTVNICKV
jgi:hypothetical protein